MAKSEIELHLNTANNKLRAANELYRLGYFDDTVSRAYYAMFHAAKAALISIGVDTHSHHGVVAQLGQHFVQTKKIAPQYGRMLSTAMQLREGSDYDVFREATQAEAAGILRDAQDFVGMIEALL